MAGNGYVRQSIADIINGENITAPPLNAEFNTLEYAFNEQTGHTHDGSIGNAPPINLVTSVSGYLPAIHGGVGGRNNTSQVTDPSQLDDVNGGYAVGSIWVNTSTKKVFICFDPTVGSAVWHEFAAINPQGIWSPVQTGTVDLGTDAKAFRDLYLTGAVKAATLDGVIGANAPQDITGETITANAGFTGDLTGDVLADDGTVVLSHGTDGTDATFLGDVTGNVVGDVTGTLTGDIRGDVRSDNGAVVLNSGTDGSNAVFTGSVTGNVTGNLRGDVYSSNGITKVLESGSSTDDAVFTGNVVGNVTGNTQGTHTGPVNADGNRIEGVADPEYDTDVVTKGYFTQVLAESEDGIGQSLNAAVEARNQALGFRNEAEQFRNTTSDYRTEAKGYRDEAEQYAAVAIDKAAIVSFLYDSAQYNQRLIGSLI
jgi:hypothetical protein